MTPYYEDRKNGLALYHGDCRDIIPELGTVDTVITDPPYTEKTHAGARTKCSGKGLAVRKLINFESISDKQFLGFCGLFVNSAYRWVIMTCDWRHVAIAVSGDLPIVRCGVWVKPDAAPQFTGDRPGTGWEAVLILHRKGKKRWNGGGHHAVWTCPVERSAHPTMKPLRLISQWVRLFSDRGETVLDPFAGSGTTGVACLLNGRRFIGVEIEERYCEIAARRLESRGHYRKATNGLGGFGLMREKGQ